MFPTGSKLLIGATGLAIVAAVVYGSTVGGSLGTIGLVSLATALALVTGVVIHIRDANPDPGADPQSSAAAAQAPTLSPWPLLSVVGLVSVIIGSVTQPAFTILGIVVTLAGALEWMIQAWSERTSASNEYNAEIRTRMMGPLEVPVAAALVAGLVVYGFSRVMLTVSKTASIVAFGIAAVIVLAVAASFVGRERVSGRTIAGAVAAGALLLVVGGAASALNGERSIHVHETTGDLATTGGCGPEATEADEKFSQTVGAKSNQAATVTLGADDQLSVSVPGFNDSSSRVTLHRANPNNVLFRNDSDHERRLAIDLGAPDADSESRTVCTALVEPGGVQLLTLYFDKPSRVQPDGYRFEVPGVDGTSVEVVVP